MTVVDIDGALLLSPRVLVVPRLAAEMAKIQVGDGMDTKTGMGPVCGTEQKRIILGYIRKGLEEGIRWAKGEITLRTTVLVLPDPPPEFTAAEVTATPMNE